MCVITWCTKPLALFQIWEKSYVICKYLHLFICFCTESFHFIFPDLTNSKQFIAELHNINRDLWGNLSSNLSFIFSLSLSLLYLLLSQAALGYSGICSGFWCRMRVLQSILPLHRRRGSTLKTQLESLHRFSTLSMYGLTWYSFVFILQLVDA